jgi:hypothetical protein
MIAGERATSLEEAQKRGLTINILGAGLCDVLASNGWIVQSDLGKPILLQNGNDVIAPFEIMSKITEGKFERAEWDRLFAPLANVSLIEASANEAAA